MHVWDLDLFSVDEFISSKHVTEFPLDEFGTKSSPAVMPFGKIVHGSPTSGAKVDDIVVDAGVSFREQGSHPEGSNLTHSFCQKLGSN